MRKTNKIQAFLLKEALKNSRLIVTNCKLYGIGTAVYSIYDLKLDESLFKSVNADFSKYEQKREKLTLTGDIKNKELSVLKNSSGEKTYLRRKHLELIEEKDLEFYLNDIFVCVVKNEQLLAILFCVKIKEEK